MSLPLDGYRVTGCRQYCQFFMCITISKVNMQAVAPERLRKVQRERQKRQKEGVKLQSGLQTRQQFALLCTSCGCVAALFLPTMT